MEQAQSTTWPWPTCASAVQIPDVANTALPLTGVSFTVDGNRLCAAAGPTLFVLDAFDGAVRALPVPASPWVLLHAAGSADGAGGVQGAGAKRRGSAASSWGSRRACRQQCSHGPCECSAVKVLLVRRCSTASTRARRRARRPSSLPSAPPAPTSPQARPGAAACSRLALPALHLQCPACLC